MREREMLEVTKWMRVNSFVDSLINTDYKQIIISGSEKIVYKCHGDPTFR